MVDIARRLGIARGSREERRRKSTVAKIRALVVMIFQTICVGYHENLLNIRSISDRIKHCLDLTTGVARYARMLPVCFSSPR